MKSVVYKAASLSPQDRLERVWTLLCMPDGQRLDMAIKYSAEPYSNNLLEVSEMARCFICLVWSPDFAKFAKLPPVLT